MKLRVLQQAEWEARDAAAAILLLPRQPHVGTLAEIRPLGKQPGK